MKTGRNKRRFAAISLSLGMLAALGGFTACAEKDEAQGAQVKATFSFDTFEELHGVKTKNFQGKLSLGTGEGMFTEGKASMKLSVAKPATYIYHRYSERKDFLTPIFSLPIRETDLAATAAFTMDVFNANAYDSGVYLFAKNVGGEVIYSAYGAARANEWNKLSFPVNQAFVSEKITEIYVSVADTNENTVYYFDNFVSHAGQSAPISAHYSGNVISALSSAEELRALNVFTKTHFPAFHAALASDPEDGSRTVVSLVHESYGGGENSVSYWKDGRLYGFTLSGGAIAGFDFSAMKYCSIEAYNAMPFKKKVTISLSDGETTKSAEAELPVTGWTKLRVENPFGENVKEISITASSYDNFRAGNIYFKNLTAEGAENEN